MTAVRESVSDERARALVEAIARAGQEAAMLGREHRGRPIVVRAEIREGECLDELAGLGLRLQLLRGTTIVVEAVIAVKDGK